MENTFKILNCLTILFAIVLITIKSGHCHHGHEHDDNDHAHDEITDPSDPDWSRAITLKRTVSIDLKWNESSSEWLTFEMSTKTTGWIGIGFCPVWHGSMQDCDIVIGWVDNDGKPQIMDLFSKGNEQPVQDSSQDYEIIEGSEMNGTTTLRFRRKWDTMDVDTDINFMNNDKAQIIWAWHPSDPTEDEIKSNNIPPHDENTRGHTLEMIVFKHPDAESQARIDSSANKKAISLFTIFVLIFNCIALR